MKIFHWFLLFLSAFLYALPFLFIHYLWWLIFFFPIPLLYIICTQNISFVHGYVWGITTLFLHTYGGIYVISCMAGKSWPIGLLLGITVVLYQALSIAIFFWCATLIAHFFELQSFIARICLWAIALLFFIIWTDNYCLWIFGVKEGYPLMHPLIPLAQCPRMLFLLPIIGKSLLAILFLLFSVTSVFLIQLRSRRSFFVWIIMCMPWVLSWCGGDKHVYKQQILPYIVTIPFMTYLTAHNATTMMKILSYSLKNVIAQYPQTTIIIMPESAFNCTIFGDNPELFEWLNEKYIGKAVYCVFGSFRWDDKRNYYNTAYVVHNGRLQQSFDKRHAMLISERLGWLMYCKSLQNIYCGMIGQTAIAAHDRLPFILSDDVYIPYICSELFFNENCDDRYNHMPIIALINDSIFLSPGTEYVADLLFLVARTKAIAWQRDIMYVSYSRSFCIDKYGNVAAMNVCDI